MVAKFNKQLGNADAQNGSLPPKRSLDTMDAGLIRVRKPLQERTITRLRE